MEFSLMLPANKARSLFNASFISNTRCCLMWTVPVTSSSCQEPFKSYPLRNMIRSCGRFNSIKYFKDCRVLAPSDNKSLKKYTKSIFMGTVIVFENLS